MEPEAQAEPSTKRRDDERSAGISAQKISLLTVLYFVQGLPFGFFLFTFPLHLRGHGYSLAQITLISVVNLPWLVKFLWAPLADRYFWRSFGRRRSWILPAQGGLVGSLVLTGLFAGELGLWGLMAALTVVNLCAATQDIGVDGLAVDILDDHERGVGNSVQAAAYKVGMLGGGFGLTWLLGRWGLSGCFLVMGAVVALAMLAPFFLSEPDPPIDPFRGSAKLELRALIGQVAGLFQRPGAGLFIGFILIVKVGDAIANPLFRLFLKDSRIPLADINWSMNLAGMAATLLGSAMCGFLIRIVGRRAALWMTVAGQGLSHLGWAALAVVGVDIVVVYGVGVFEHLVSGMLTVVVFTIMMDAVRPEAGSSQYTLLMCLHLGSAFGLGMASGAIAQLGGYSFAFALAGAVTLGCLLMAGRLEHHGYLSGRREEAASVGLDS